MSLILVQEAANAVPTPGAGKGTVFLNTSDQVSVKDSAGNIATFPTISPTGNTSVFYNDEGALSTSANLTFDNTTNTFTVNGFANVVGNLTANQANFSNADVSGTFSAGNVKTDNLLYANGNPWDLQQPGGSNTQIQFNDEDQFGGSAAFTFDKSSNAVSLSGNISAGNISSGGALAVTGNASAGNLSTGGSLTVNGNASAGNISTGGVLSVTGNANVGNLGTGGLIVATGNVTGGNLVTTGTVSTAELTTTGNAIIGGNLTVNGNITYVNVDSLQVEDPVIAIGGGPNGDPLTSNDGKDRGTLLHYYTTQAIDAFMGWDTGNSEFGFGSNVSIANDVVTFNTYGNVRASTILANIDGSTGAFTGNVTAGNIFANSGEIGANTGNFSGNLSAGGIKTDNLYYANGNPWDLQEAAGSNTQIQFNDGSNNFGASANLTFNTATDTLTVTGKIVVPSNNAVRIGPTSNLTSYPNVQMVSSFGTSGVVSGIGAGIIGEAVGVASVANLDVAGVGGVAVVNGAGRASGVIGSVVVTDTNDTGAATGVRGIAIAPHAGGYNIGVLGNASGSGLGNYAFYVQAGGIASIETDTFWDLNDDSTTALAFNSTGKANILAITTEDGNEGVIMSGTLEVTGNITATAGLKTDNLYYANGSPWDLQEAAGSNNQIQYNIDNNFAASANFTYNDSTQLFTVLGNGAFNNVNAGNLLTANFIAGALTTNAQPNITSVGTLTSLDVSGNLTSGNANLGNLAIANFVTGTLTTNAQPNITSVGTLTGLTVDGSNITLANGVYVGNAAGLTNIPGGNITGNISGNISNADHATTANTVVDSAQPNITSVGTLTSLSVTGNLSAGNISTGGVLSVTGNANVGNLGTAGLITATGNVSGGNITTAGVVSATGNVTGGNLTTAGALSVTGNANVGNIGAAAGVFTTVDGTLTTAAQPNITSVGTLTSLAVTGNVTAGNVSATDVSGTTLGGTLTTAAQPNVTSVGTLTGLGVNGNITAANITANTGVFTGNGSGLSQLAGGNVTGQVANALVAGTVYTNAQPNITSVGTLTSLSVTGNVAAGNLTTTGILSVTGTGVSSIAGNLDMTSNNIVNLADPVGAQDAATKAYVDNIASTGIHYHTPVRVESPVALTATYNNGTAGVGATLTNSGANAALVIDGISLNVADRVLIYQQTDQTTNGVYVVTTVGDGSTAWVLTRASDADTYAPSTSTGLDEGSYFYVQEGNTGAGESYVCNTVGTITFGTTNITFAQFSASQVYQAGTGLTLTNTTFSVNASQSQITSVGTLTGLNVNGNITAANITANTGVFTGNGSGLSAIAGGNVTGQVANALVAGTVYTAAQPNITSVGTLTSLGVNGTVTAVAFTANTGVFTGNGSGLSALAGGNVTGQVANALVAGTVYTAAQPNITSVGTLTSLAVTGNASAGNISTGGALSVTGNANVGNIGATNGVFTNVSGNGAALTALNASNISSGTLDQARLANASLTVNGVSITLGGSGTVTASTTNTLTLGTYLTGGSFNGGSAVTAAVDATSAATASKVVARDTNGSFAGNVITATTFSGSGASLTSLNGSNISTGTIAAARVATLNQNTTGYAATVSSAAQPNITSVGTLTSLAVTGNISGGNLSVSTGTVTLGTLTTGANTTAGTVTGNWTLSTGSRWNATYADLAEKYVADADYEPGTVLIFGGEQEVTLANEFDSTRVAGVVTTNPAFSMNNECAGEHVAEIALQGRVPCKVHGPVAKGDLMVAGQNGHAVANNMARAGTIIGKALQNFEGGSGVIEVAVGRF